MNFTGSSYTINYLVGNFKYFFIIGVSKCCHSFPRSRTPLAVKKTRRLIFHLRMVCSETTLQFSSIHVTQGVFPPLANCCHVRWRRRPKMVSCCWFVLLFKNNIFFKIITHLFTIHNKLPLTTRFEVFSWNILSFNRNMLIYYIL